MKKYIFFVLRVLVGVGMIVVRGVGCVGFGVQCLKNGRSRCGGVSGKEVCY